MKIIGAIIGAALGLGIGYWWLSPAQSVDQVGFPKLVSTLDILQDLQAKDDVALQGICSVGSVKALPSGKLAICSDDAQWRLPAGL